MSDYDIHSVNVQNLRGYYTADLSLKRRRTVLVGPYNSGKTSVLRLLGWVINELDEDLASQMRPLSRDEEVLLLPARDAKHRARRLTLRVFVRDARSWSKFKCNGEGVAHLRINIRVSPRPVVYLALGRPRRGESATTDDNARELLNRVRSSIRFIHIPSFRDAKSERFNATLHSALRARIEERALHTARSGSPREHREVAQKLTELEEMLLDLANPLWDDVSEQLPPGLAKNATLDFDCDQSTFLNFLESRLQLRISTGEHDSLAVPMPELGSGLQSLLDLAFQDSEQLQDVRTIIAAEEPEAFLHPSAQRAVASSLLRGATNLRRVIITTHSPIVVEEAKFGTVVLCRQQKFYEPKGLEEERRSEINSALLSGYGAEMVYGKSILLVEGDGDRQFFERLRRRISRHDPSGAVDQCFVVPVGSKSFFRPWIGLLRAYGDAADRPIQYLVAPDGDATTDVRKAFNDAGVTIKQEVLDALNNSSASQKNVDEWRTALTAVNRLSQDYAFPLHFLTIDLEDAALSSASDRLFNLIANKLNWPDNPSRKDVLSRLGSKGHGGSDGRKDPYIRGIIGQEIAPDRITECVRTCLVRWIALATNSRTEAEEILVAWEACQGNEEGAGE